MTTVTKKLSPGVRAYEAATMKIEALEIALTGARRLRAHAVHRMRDDGYSWAQVEEVTGLTRQRLHAIVREHPHP